MDKVNNCFYSSIIENFVFILKWLAIDLDILLLIFWLKGLTHARYVPPPTTEITPTEFLEYSATNTSCFVCGIGNPGFGFRKCSSNYEGDLVETMPLIIASNSLLKTNNSFKGCLTIYTNGGNELLKTSF